MCSDDFAMNEVERLKIIDFMSSPYNAGEKTPYVTDVLVALSCEILDLRYRLSKLEGKE